MSRVCTSTQTIAIVLRYVNRLGRSYLFSALDHLKIHFHGVPVSRFFVSAVTMRFAVPCSQHIHTAYRPLTNHPAITSSSLKSFSSLRGIPFSSSGDGGRLYQRGFHTVRCWSRCCSVANVCPVYICGRSQFYVGRLLDATSSCKLSRTPRNALSVLTSILRLSTDSRPQLLTLLAPDSMDLPTTA